MKIVRLLALSVLMSAGVRVAIADNVNKYSRGLWGSIAQDPSSGAINLGDYKTANGKLLISWRMLPGDDSSTSFDLWRKIGNGKPSKTNAFRAITSTSYSPAISSVKGDNTFYLTYHTTSLTFDASAVLDSFTMKQTQIDNKLPYISIPLKTTEDVDANADIVYYANDCSVGDLDGDGVMDIVVKRIMGHKSNNNTDEGTGAADTDPNVRHTIIFDAYKLDGTLLWRIKSGPNIIQGNSVNFGVADLDGDGKCEFVTKTSEGTVFGDGAEIADTDGDGKTDYRSVWPAGHYQGDGPNGYGGPEFFSVCDGLTGKELARADFITRGKEGETPAEMAANWEANDWTWDPRTKKYPWKLANSLRLGIASFDGHNNQIFLGRGVYGRTVVEGWNYSDGKLTRMWKFDSSESGGNTRNKDGKLNSSYAAQGNHAFNVADLDGDGNDEVMYGSCAFDDDGAGLWTTGLGHGDANHVGKFIADRDGLQMWHCLENGKTMAALHDAKDGRTLWSMAGSGDNDTGRCLIADIDPSNKGYEIWWAGSNAYTIDGRDLGYKPSSCNMAIWFDGTLSRQLINEGIIDSPKNGRAFTMYRYDMSFNNGTKSNPGWYGDMLGDWREEVIVPSGDKLSDLKLFTTWYPTEFSIPWLMLDHTYKMQCIQQQQGYNQPTHTGFYFGSNQTNAELVERMISANPETFSKETGISVIESSRSATAKTPDSAIYNLQGQRIVVPKKGQIYIKNGQKFVWK